MPGLQDFIHQLEEGAGARHIKIAVAILGLVVLAVAYDLREYRNFSSPEAMDLAQTARNLAEGRGYSTRFIRPFSVALMSQHLEGARVLKEEHPDLANAPVYPVVLAGLMKILPFDFNLGSGALFWRYQPDFLIAIFSQLIFAGIIVLMFRMALRLFDATVAWLTLFTLAGASLFWEFSVSGTPMLLLTLLFCALCWTLARLEEATRETTKSEVWFAGMAALAGVLLGLGALTRYSFGWLLLPTIAFLGLFMQTRRVKLILITTGICLGALAPWIYRNVTISGAPFGTAGFAIYEETKSFPRTLLERSVPRSLDVELNKIELSEFLRKLFINAAERISTLPTLGGSWVAAFFLAGLLAPFRNPVLSRLRYFLVLSLFVGLVVESLGRTWLFEQSKGITSENLTVIFAPVVFLFGTALFVTLLDQLELPLPQLRTWICALFVLIMSLPLVFVFLPPRNTPIVYPPYYPPILHETARWMGEEEMMMSDMPWAVAWYGDRRCLWLTLDTGNERDSDFFTINDFQKPIQGLYLSSLTMDSRFLSEMLKSREGAWSRFVLESLMRTNIPPGFPLKHAPSGFLPEQLFLSDRIRWKNAAK